jgi:GT2 family glycosyltransferase
MPEISVIVLNWNGKHFLETCLLSLRRQTFRDFEVIVVDNGSEDGSAEYVLDQFPEVRLLRLERNVGFCSGNLAGYERATGELIVLLNNDTEADPYWLEEIRRASEDFSEAGSFASKMLFYDDRQRIDNCGFALTTSGVTIDLGRNQKDGEKWAEPRKVFGACGGAAAYRRSMLEKIGFLDAEFFMTYEDVDMSFRAQLFGYECVFVPGAVVYHRYRATMKNYPARQVFFSQRNIEFVYMKNMPLGLMLRFLPLRFVYELGGAVYFLKQGAGRAYLKAKVDALRRLPSFLPKRQMIQAKRVLNNDELRSVMLQKTWLSLKWQKFASAWRRFPEPSA